MIYTCRRCGQQFEATHKTAVCKNCKTSFCVICGKEFELQWPYTAKTCSSACRGKYGQMTGQQKRAGEAGNRALKKNPHVWTKKCVLCGTEFTTTSARKKYCDNDHYGPCPVCGKQVKIKELYLGPQACSEECRQARIQQTCLEKYGNQCAVNSEFARAKAKETCLEKYGTDHFSKTVEYQKKYEATMMERYGVASPLQNEEIKQKTKETNQRRYGGNSPMCSEAVKEKSLKSALENHGGFGFDSTELNERIQSTMLERYGVDNPMKSEEIREKTRQTCLQKYGATNYWASDMYLAERMQDGTKMEQYKQFYADPESYIRTNYSSKPTVQQLCKDVGVTDTRVYAVLLEAGCRDMATYYHSSMEHEIVDWLNSSVPGIKIISNDRAVIRPQEIDIYLPEYKLGIECNPTITHNSTFADPWGRNIGPTYHRNKSRKASESNVFLFHVFGYEWKHKQDIIKSMLINLLHETNSVIYARNTKVVELSYEKCKEFLDVNHRQGNTNASIRLGLMDKYNSELVSVMTFNAIRSSIGSQSSYEGGWELSRFCNILNTSVVGGASKLFKYFLKNYSPEKVVSFSDVAHTRGHLYEVLGFHQVSISEPGYVWVNTIDDSYLSRVACRKANLPKLFHEPDLDIEHMTEREIMASHGYAQVFDSGVIRWEYFND